MVLSLLFQFMDFGCTGSFSCIFLFFFAHLDSCSCINVQKKYFHSFVILKTVFYLILIFFVLFSKMNNLKIISYTINGLLNITKTPVFFFFFILLQSRNNWYYLQEINPSKINSWNQAKSFEKDSCWTSSKILLDFCPFILIS